MSKNLYPLPALEYFKGTVSGRVLTLDTRLSRFAGFVVLVGADVYKSFLNPVDTKTPYLDEALAFLYGIVETGPGAHFMGVSGIKNTSKTVPLSDDWAVRISETSQEVRLSLIEGERVVFSAFMTQAGLEYEWVDDFNPHWASLDRGLAYYVVPYIGVEPRRAIADLCTELGILKKDRKQG